MTFLPKLVKFEITNKDVWKDKFTKRINVYRGFGSDTYWKREFASS